MLKGFFASRPAIRSGRRLFSAASHQARAPVFYGGAGVPDTPEGRFELLTLHVVLLLHRLRGQGAQAAEISQALFDSFLNNLDEGLRELGVGDLSVGKKMRKLGEAVYGRIKGYDAAFEALPDGSRLKGLIGRTMFDTLDDTSAVALAAYAAAAQLRLSGAPLSDILQARLQWPDFDRAG